VQILEYPKINTIWKRESEKPCRIIVGEYSRPEFESVNRWHVTEKIDGTNVRVVWDGEKVEFRGRTDNAQMPTKLMLHLQQAFTVDKMRDRFTSPVILFGEGYGAGIQKGGGNYSPDQKFILFDVLIDKWWMEPDSVQAIAASLDIFYVPKLGTMNTEDIVSMVANGQISASYISSLAKIEGVVCRSVPSLFNRKGERVMWKIKVKDYEALKA
jgi:hypothetical protein